MASSQNYQLGLLPEHKPNWRALASSYGFVLILLAIVVNLGLFFPDSLQIARKYTVTEIIPLPNNAPKPPEPPKPQYKAKLLPPAPVIEVPKLVVPREIQVKKTPPPEPEAPKLEAKAVIPPVLKVDGGARPVQAVHTGDFGSSATPTVNAPIAKVQTGGFGDPNGLTGQGKANAKLVAANTGAFDLPQGTGTGNGSGGAKGIKGTVASAGFGNGIAQPGNGDGRSNGRAQAQMGGFGSTEVSQAKAHLMDSGATTSSVEILYKPNPVYTDEARQLQLQGEVLLEVSFGANGQLQVNKVVRGLGHGLDEAAVAAANKMKFKPALRAGVPVDSTAVVHVVFQLAM